MAKELSLYQLKRDLLDELNDRKKEILEDEYPDDLIRGIVDSFIPLMTHDLLEVAQSELWLAVDEPEIMAFGGENSAVNAIAGNLYDHLFEIALEWLDEKSD